MRPLGTLASRLAAALATEPRSSVWLAREVLGLGGPPLLLQKTAEAILRSDPRVEAGPDGLWRLRATADSGAHRDLHRLSFAVVDVETTGGGYERGDRITEIAVVPVEGGVVGDGFTTLVNPGCPIPPRIQSLTGISNAMVAGAPPFEAIAGVVSDRLEGRVFTAHNVAFDWGFVGRSLTEAHGAAPVVDRLCTVRMGRALVPGLSSYALDALTRQFGIRIEGRHRAWGDALATARLLVHLLDRAVSEGIEDWHGLLARVSPGSGPKAPRGGRPPHAPPTPHAPPPPRPTGQSGPL